jgi:epoxyqueuosine reductase
METKMKEKIIEIANKVGFDLIGFSICEKVEEEFIDFYITYLKNNYNGEMKYLEKNIEKKFDPKKILQDAKTIISLGVNYYTEIPEDCLFPRYLTRVDYHIEVKRMLYEFVKELKKLIKDIKYKFFVDSSPIFEKYWARKSGIGFTGKNSLIINKNFGSFIFLSEVIINVEIEPDKEMENLCGNCRKCIESCPTGAIIKEGIIDARKCISYLTIEKKSKLNEIEESYIKKGNKIFGCEICQDVCPFNKNLKETEKLNLKLPEELKNLKIKDIKEIPEELKKILKESALKRRFKDLFL